MAIRYEYMRWNCKTCGAIGSVRLIQPFRGYDKISDEDLDHMRKDHQEKSINCSQPKLDFCFLGGPTERSVI
jgi:hypothetical protein